MFQDANYLINPRSSSKEIPAKIKVKIYLAHHSTDFYGCNFSCLNRIMKEQKAPGKDSRMRKLPNPLKYIGSNSTLEAKDCHVLCQFWNGVANKLDPIPALMEVTAKQKTQAREISPRRVQGYQETHPKIRNSPVGPCFCDLTSPSRF